MHASTLGRVTVLRHFPTWTTSGTSVPTGTPRSSKDPSAAVVATAAPKPGVQAQVKSVQQARSDEQEEVLDDKPVAKPVAQAAAASKAPEPRVAEAKKAVESGKDTKDAKDAKPAAKGATAADKKRAASLLSALGATEWAGFLLSGLLGSAGHYCLTRGFAAAEISATQEFVFKLE